MQIVFYPLLLRSMPNAHLQCLPPKATSISVAYKILTFSEKIKLRIWCADNSHQMPSFIFSDNKSIASIIPRHSNYLLCIKVIVAKMSGKKMTEGQIIILNQILIISMHIASLVKRPCYLLKLSSRNENMGVSRAENSIKIWRNSAISNSLPDLLIVNTYSKFG